MATNRQPILKRCKTLQIEPGCMGIFKKSNRNQQQNNRKKQSEYALQLNEKQKVRFIYGVLEKQFAKYYERANHADGVTGELMLSYLERRLDNVAFRLGYASTRRQARQIVNHGHLLVNGKKADIPSMLVKPGDEITICEKSLKSEGIKAILDKNSSLVAPKWISKDTQNNSATITAMPQRDDIDFEVNETLIVEYYSK